MNQDYDFVFLTNTPSFYKLNLCRELAKKHSLLLVLLGYGSEAVNQVPAQEPFDVVFLHEGDLHRRNKLHVFFRLLRLMRSVRATVVLYSGWFVPEFNIYSFLSPRRRNAIICESSVLDSPFSGVKGWLKRRIINRMRAALPSGKPHVQLFEQIRFKGSLHPTGGVGLIHFSPRSARTETKFPLRYLFVGRLIPVKNVLMLAQEFKRNGKALTIVGSGPLEQDIRKLNAPNITLTGFIPNEQLAEVYRAHDVFILPSRYEPWGLVAEEALYHGLPVLASQHVGCAGDLIARGDTGELFTPEEPDSLTRAMHRVEQQYKHYLEKIRTIPWEKRKMQQLQAYSELIDRCRPRDSRPAHAAESEKSF